MINFDYEKDNAYEIAEKLEEFICSEQEGLWQLLHAMPVNEKTLEALLSVLEDMEIYEIYDLVLWDFQNLLTEQKYNALMAEYRKIFNAPLSFDPIDKWENG